MWSSISYSMLLDTGMFLLLFTVQNIVKTETAVISKGLWLQFWEMCFVVVFFSQ